MNADEEKNAVRQLGELMGYDRVVQIAQQLLANSRDNVINLQRDAHCCAQCAIPMTSATADGNEDGLYCDKCLTELVDATPSVGQMASALRDARNEISTQREAVKQIIPLADELDQDRGPADQRLASLDRLLGTIDAALTPGKDNSAIQ